MTFKPSRRKHMGDHDALIQAGAAVLSPGGAGFAPPGRQGGIFTPSSRSGLLRWYESGRSAVYQNSDGTGTVANGDPVGYWQDLSTYAEHGLQTTAGDKPLYRASDVTLGTPAIDFVSSDFLKWTTALTLTSFDLWAIVTFDTLGAFSFYPLLGSSASDSNYVGITGNGTPGAVQANNYNTNNANITLSGGALATATKYIIEVTRSGSITTCYINNVSQGTVSQAASLVAVDQLASRGNKTSTLDGKISVLLLYGAAPTADERDKTYLYLSGYDGSGGWYVAP